MPRLRHWVPGRDASAVSYSRLLHFRHCFDKIFPGGADLPIYREFVAAAPVIRHCAMHTN